METLNPLSVVLDVQNPNNIESLPTFLAMKSWCEAALQAQSQQRAFENTLSLLIRVIDNDESTTLNQNYRNKEGPTNVLSFPNDTPDFMREISELSKQNSHLGDLLICEPLIYKEAIQQGKSVISHWAHLIIHGTLHLQGFDHITETEATAMEALEIHILEQLGFENPYKT